MNASFLRQGSIISTTIGHAAVGYGEYQAFPRPPESDVPSFYFPDFFLDESEPWYQFEQSKVIKIDQLSQSPSAQLYQCDWQIEGTEAYEEAFKELMHAFKRGDLKKAVPYLFYKTQATFNLSHSLSHLVRHSLKHPTHLYGLWSDECGILGGTPEQLFEIDSSGILKTSAVAGTVESGREDELIQNPKLRLEHNLVIEGIYESLAPFGVVKVGETEILRLSHFSHTKTPISVQLNSTDCIESLVRSLHPTPALGAFPKQNGGKWLSNYAKRVPRGRYGSPVGVKIGDAFYCYVAIRNIQWNNGTIRIGVGGGLVEGSEKKDEQRELALKFEATRTMLNI